MFLCTLQSGSLHSSQLHFRKIGLDEEKLWMCLVISKSLLIRRNSSALVTGNSVSVLFPWQQSVLAMRLIQELPEPVA